MSASGSGEGPSGQGPRHGSRGQTWGQADVTGTGPFGFQYYNLQAPTTGYLPTTTHSQEITSGAEDLMFQELLDTPWHDIMPSPEASQSFDPGLEDATALTKALSSSNASPEQSEIELPSPSAGASMDIPATHQCGTCQEQFTSTKALRRHRGEQHLLKKLWICPICSLMARPHDQGLSCRYCSTINPTCKHFVDCHYACISQFDTKTFKRRNDYDNHVRSTHPHLRAHLGFDEWQYQDPSSDILHCCDRCGEISRGLAAAERHRAQMKGRGGRGNHNNPNPGSPEARLTYSIQCLLHSDAIRGAWTAYLAAHRFPLDLARNLRWAFTSHSSCVLYYLERFDVSISAAQFSEELLFQQIVQSALRAH